MINRIKKNQEVNESIYDRAMNIFLSWHDRSIKLYPFGDRLEQILNAAMKTISAE